jgi:uncharacterized RDD family membrane protein YckC
LSSKYQQSTIVLKNGSDPGPSELDNRVRVITPENIEFDYRVAGPFIRGIAYFLDVALLTCFFLLVAILLLFVGGLFLAWLASIGWTGAAEIIGTLGWTFFAIFVFFAMWSYGAICEAKYHGRTLGKLMTKLRVITRHGHKITYGQAFVRNLVRYGELLPWLSLSFIFPLPDTSGDPLLAFWSVPWIPSCLVALLAITLNSKNQRIGDMLAGTIVIIEESAAQQKFARFSDPRVQLLAEQYIPPGYVVSPELTKALADYGLRRNRMSIERAREIAAYLANYLMIEFNLPRDTCPDLLLCALYYRTFLADDAGKEEGIAPQNQPYFIQ